MKTTLDSLDDLFIIVPPTSLAVGRTCVLLVLFDKLKGTSSKRKVEGSIEHLTFLG